MVLADDLVNFLPKAVFLGKLHALPHVGEDDEAAHAGREVPVRVVVMIVFYEVMGHLQLSDVVVVSGDPGQDGVGAYAFGGRFA